MSNKTMKTVYSCAACGSENVYCDAWVGLNDPDDVMTFDTTHCENCEGECSINEREEEMS